MKLLRPLQLLRRNVRHRVFEASPTLMDNRQDRYIIFSGTFYFLCATQLYAKPSIAFIPSKSHQALAPECCGSGMKLIAFSTVCRALFVDSSLYDIYLIMQKKKRHEKGKERKPKNYQKWPPGYYGGFLLSIAHSLFFTQRPHP